MLTQLFLGGRYQQYLESVLEVAEEHHEIGDLTMRHATLIATNDDLKEQQKRCAALAEQTRYPPPPTARISRPL